MSTPPSSAQAALHPRPRRLLIVRLGAMGDILHAMPAVHLLRREWPECEVDWVVERRWTPLLTANPAAEAALHDEASESQPLVDRVFTIDTRAWRKNLLGSSTRSDVRRSLGALRARKYDAAIDFQGSIKSAVLASLAGASTIVGFAHPREWAAKMFYTDTFASDAAHVVTQNIELAAFATGAQPEALPCLLPRDARAEQFADEFLRSRSISRFAVLNPTAGWASKQWPIERYAEVARALRENGVASLINFGPGEESVASRLERDSGGAAQPLSCGIAELTAVLRRAALFVGGDTGPMHMATALQVPVVALFGPTDPQRNGPFGTRAVVLRNPLSRTSYSHTSQPDAGLERITAAEVIAAARSLLE